MRFAFVTTSYPKDEGDPSGHFVRAEARARVAAGDQVTVIAPLPRRPKVNDGVRVVAIDGGAAFGWPGVAARVAEAPWRAVAAGAWVAKARRALVACDRASKLDRVVAHWAVPSAFPIATAIDAPVEIVSHGGDVRLLTRAPNAARALIVARLVRRASVWRFVSATLRDELLEGLTARQRRDLEVIAVVAESPIEMPDDGLLTRHADELRATLSAGRAFVAVGRLVAGKRVEAIVEHATFLGKTGGSRVVLVVVGDGPERARLEKLAVARRGDVDVRFVGSVDRETALAWMRATGTLLFASRHEGQSTVLREAALLGVSVERVD